MGSTIVPFTFLNHILAKNQTCEVLNCEIYLVHKTFLWVWITANKYVHIFLITIVNVYKKFIKRKFELTPDAKNLNIYKDFCIFGREREFLH